MSRCTNCGCIMEISTSGCNLCLLCINQRNNEMVVQSINNIQADEAYQRRGSLAKQQERRELFIKLCLIEAEKKCIRLESEYRDIQVPRGDGYIEIQRNKEFRLAKMSEEQYYSLRLAGNAILKAADEFEKEEG